MGRGGERARLGTRPTTRGGVGGAELAATAADAKASEQKHDQDDDQNEPQHVRSVPVIGQGQTTHVVGGRMNTIPAS
jgi:hypothetical protein